MEESERRQRRVEEERKKIRRLRFLVDLTTNVLYQDATLSLQEARQLIGNTEKAVLRLFPGKERTFEIVLLSRFERILYERWGVGLDSRVQ